MLVRSTVFLLSCVLLGCGAYAQDKPGGKGELNLYSPRWVDPKTGKTVKIGSITILYQYSTLLQEPIEKYNMKWERAQSAGANSASGVEPTSIYNIRFRARVTSETGIGTGATIDFTPDIVPEAGTGFARLAIGGSPSWGKMFREEGSETYLSAERAKEIFRNRFQLADARIIQLGAGLKDHDEEAKKLAELERKKEELKKKSEELDALRQQVAESDASGEEEIDNTIKQARLSIIERERELKSEEGRLRAQEAEQRKMAEAEKLARAEANTQAKNKNMDSDGQAQRSSSLPRSGEKRSASASKEFPDAIYKDFSGMNSNSKIILGIDLSFDFEGSFGVQNFRVGYTNAIRDPKLKLIALGGGRCRLDLEARIMSADNGRKFDVPPDINGVYAFSYEYDPNQDEWRLSTNVDSEIRSWLPDTLIDSKLLEADRAKANQEYIEGQKRRLEEYRRKN